MSAHDDARDLLRAAARDRRALDAMMESAVVADEIFGFHVQQAIEKGLKAWIAAHAIEYPRTHDLGVLLATLASLGRDVAGMGHLTA